MRAETLLQRQIRKLLALKGYRSVACSNGAVLAGDARSRAIQMNVLKSAGLVPGFPDLVVYGPDGRIGHLEVKLPGEDPTENQIKCRDWLHEFGHLYAVVRDLGEVDGILEQWGW